MVRVGFFLLLLTTPAWAQVPPDEVATVQRGVSLHVRPHPSLPREMVRVIRVGALSDFVVDDYTLELQSEHVSSSAIVGTGIQSIAASAYDPVADLDLLADPDGASLWGLSQDAAGFGTLVASEHWTEWPNGTAFTSPVAVASCCGGVLFAEGAAAGATPPSLGVGQGEIGFRVGEGLVRIGSAGPGADQLPLDATKGLAVDPDGNVIAVTGEPSRFVKFHPPDGGAQAGELLAAWTVSPYVTGEGDLGSGEGTGSPTEIVGLAGGEVLIGGPRGIARYDASGCRLGWIWQRQESSGVLLAAEELLALSANADGTWVHALFATSADATIIAAWDTSTWSPPAGAELLVDATGAGTHETIQAAIDDAGPYDLITIRAGHWNESPFLVDKCVGLTAEEGHWGEVVIDAATGSSGVVVLSSAVEIDGIEIRGGVGLEGGGWIGRWGGGIFAYDSTLLLRRTVLADNSADQGGGIHATSMRYLGLVNVLFEGNTAAVNGAAIWTMGGYLQGPGPLDSAQVTFAGNVTPGEGSVIMGTWLYANGQGWVVAGNSVPMGPVDDEGAEDIDFLGAFALHYSDLWSPDDAGAARLVLEGGTGNIAADPLFIADGFHDRSLDPTSPARDSGSPAGDWNEPWDGAGHTRSDMGAFSGPDGDWGPRSFGDDDDDSVPADDDSATGDDDVGGDDDTADDDDSVSGNPGPPLPTGLHCACEQGGSKGRGARIGAGLALLLPLRRRRSGRTG